MTPGETETSAAEVCFQRAGNSAVQEAGGSQLILISVYALVSFSCRIFYSTFHTLFRVRKIWLFGFKYCCCEEV